MMAFDATYIPPKMSMWTPIGIMKCMEEVDKGVDFNEKYGVGATLRMQLDCAVWCLCGSLQAMDGQDKLAIIQDAEKAAVDMMKDNDITPLDEVILRQIMADIYDAAEEAVRRWGE